MCKTIGSGLHAVTAAEIHYASLPADQRRSCHGFQKGFWPDEMSNNALRKALCVGCDYIHCSMGGCKYGQEARRRVDAGAMPPTPYMHRREEVS